MELKRVAKTGFSRSNTGLCAMSFLFSLRTASRVPFCVFFLIHHINWESWMICFSYILPFISSVKELERPQMSDFSDGHNQDAIITMLITRRRRKRKREGRKKWFNDFLQECADCSPSSQLRSIVECSLLQTQTEKHMCACTHTHKQSSVAAHRRGLTTGSSKLEIINLVGKWSLISDRNQLTACVWERRREWVKEKHVK